MALQDHPRDGQRRWLPLHPRQLPGEARSSWLAQAWPRVPTRLTSFLAWALGVEDVAPGTLDGDLSPGLFAFLSRRTGVEEERICAMTLTSASRGCSGR